mmetsp:Transcript_38946/g.102927  ORF Transcript_38946/g.102927 Transcript_38946/m.102927 type:complete len:319 (+) Transcript_38946:371-1327(+)
MTRNALVERQNRALVGSDAGGERQHATRLRVGRILLLRPDVVGVLEERGEDAVDAEGGLDDAGREGVDRLLHNLPLEEELGGVQRETPALDLHLDGAALDLPLDLLQLALLAGFEVLLHQPAVLAQLLHDGDARGLCDRGHLRLDRLVERLLVVEVALCCLRVGVEVEGGAVRDAHALQPPVGHVDLRVPAVGRVVSHLGGKVLPEANHLRLDADACEEQVGPHDEETERLVVDHALANGFADGHALWVLRRELRRRVEEREHLVLDVLELRVILLGGIHEVLDLSLRELALPSEACAGRDLVAEGPPDLRHTEGQAV